MSSHSHCARPARRFPYYAVLLYVGLVTALVAADRLARASGIDPTRLVAAFALTIPIALAGSRALEVALGWKHYRARPREILRVGAGGAAMYGALPPAFLISIPLAHWVGAPLGLYWDVALVAILAGMVPTRFGCLGAGCCAGRETRSALALRLRNARGTRARRHPVPLYEALLGAALLALALALRDRAPFPGAVAFFVCAGYGAGRFALEGLREERAPSLAGLSAYRWMSAGLVVLGTVGLALGCVSSAVTSSIVERAASADGGSLHLVLSALLLVPVVRLFRFMGCQLVFPLDEPPPGFLLQMIAVFPDLGTGPPTVSMQFLTEPGMDEIGASPIDLDPAGTEADGRLHFEKLQEIPEGDYTVTCTVSRAGAITRIGTCSGGLHELGLVVAFNAENNSAPNALQPRLCFQSL